MPTFDEGFCATAVPVIPSKCSVAALMQTKWTLLPSDEIQNDIQADAGKDETVESIRHIE